MKINNTFGNKLNQLKISHGWTSAELARRAGISEGLLSGLINDRRVAGERTARKIGNALQLVEPELADFVYAAINNCSEKTLESTKRFPAEVINLVACELEKRGITSDKIERCIRPQKDADAALQLFDGSERLIQLEFAFE